MRVIPVDTTSIFQISLYMLIRVRHDVTRITHDPDRLHAHDHMLQNVTVNPDEQC